VGTQRAPALTVDVAWRVRRSWRAVRLLRDVAHHVAAAEGFRTGYLSIAVVGARAMGALHQQYLNIPGATDVLTFDFGSDRARGDLDAEIVVCAAVARRQAAMRDRSRQAARAELALYVVHGLLHLAGHDDHTPRNFARMHRREDELLSQLGLGPVFRSETRPASIRRARGPRR
jgi:probable rRNA maturation factor